MGIFNLEISCAIYMTAVKSETANIKVGSNTSLMLKTMNIWIWVMFWGFQFAKYSFLIPPPKQNFEFKR